MKLPQDGRDIITSSSGRLKKTAATENDAMQHNDRQLSQTLTEDDRPVNERMNLVTLLTEDKFTVTVVCCNRLR